MPEIVEQLAEQFAIFGEIDIGGVGADDRDARGFQRQREIQRSLPAELDDDAVGLLDVVNVQNFFKRERLEVQAIAGVVIGGDGLRITVDHDRLGVELRERVGGVAAAVIEFNALADAVGAAAQDHDLFAIAGVGFVFRFVARIKVRRESSPAIPLSYACAQVRARSCAKWIKVRYVDRIPTP